MAKAEMVGFDTEALREAFIQTGNKFNAAERTLGIGQGVLSHALKDRKINKTYLTMVSLFLGKAPNAFLVDDTKGNNAEDTELQERLEKIERKLDLLAVHLNAVSGNTDKTNELLGFINRNICELVDTWKNE